jgi:hypothetical protein
MVGLIEIHKPWVWLLLLLTVVLLLGLKTIKVAFIPVGPPIMVGSQPVLLFFNNEEGCECVLPLYARADDVVAAWLPEIRAQVGVERIILDDRPDLGRQYDVERAPMLLLLDNNGQVVWREWGVVSNPEVFDLAAGEAQIRLLVGGT